VTANSDVTRQASQFAIPRFLVRLVATALALVVSSSAGPRQAGDQPAQPPQQHSIGKRLKGKGIPNFGQVSANLYRGGQPSLDGLEALKRMGVDVVVDLRGSASKSEEAAVTKLGMQYVSIPSHCPFPSDGPWARFLKVMRENQGKKVFVHCRLGDDRTGMAVAAYRMSEEGWPADEALNEMKEFGFSSTHHVICLGMKGYVEGFPARLKKSPAFRDLQPAK
jgi:tyrosine-protein phosphatase SIW14